MNSEQWKDQRARWCRLKEFYNHEDLIDYERIVSNLNMCPKTALSKLEEWTDANYRVTKGENPPNIIHYLVLFTDREYQRSLNNTMEAGP